MANKELDQMRSILSNLDSEATSKPQPSKTMNGGSAKIDGANPTSPSTNPATRREEYNNYIKTLNKDQQQSLYDEVKGYKSQGMTSDQIYDKVLGNSTTTPDIKEAPTTTGIDLTIKGNFDLYNPVDWESQPEMMQQYYIQANNDIKSSRRALSKLMLQQDALSSKSGNVEQVTTLIDAIENAYDRGVFDAETIANTLGVPVETVSLIQQGKANELVTLNQEFVEDELKSFYRAEEDYNTNLQRTMEDFNLAKTNLDRQYNSAMQTLKRNLFDDKRAASVGSAVAGISGSEYAVRVIEAKHQQNMDDLEGNYLYSSIQQKYSYTRAIEDYNKNIQRLSEDFDDSLKDIQASVLQQFQEIDNKIGLTTEQIAKAYGTLQQNVLAAKSTATTNYLEALSKNENGLADAIANAYGMDTSALGAHNFTAQELGRTWNETIGNATNNIGHILASNDGTRVGTYKSPNGYTYNVYATRDEGLQATIGLLQRAYYGMTLENAAQKWIGKGKDISAAKKVIQGLGLDLKSTLSDANVEKFITAMGRWEGTLGKNETLEQWLAGGKDLSSYSTETTGTGGAEEGAGTNGRYQESDHGMYESYLTGKDWSSAKIASVKNDPTYGKTEEERWKNFKTAANSYQAEKAKGSIQGIQERLDTIVEFKNRYNELNDKEREELRYAEVLDEHGLIKTAGLSERALNVANLYNQIKGQLFINGIIDSKSQGASYGNLSDAEGNRISQAASAMNLNSPSYLGTHVNYLINNLSSNISELGGKADIKSGYNYQSGNTKGTRFPRLTVVEASSLINSGASSEFNTTGGINLTSTGSTNTGTFEIPFTNMK